ncbi:MAG: MCE family protein [Candidatus Omnitrophica bacterium]|nr:MCE family protein [Candidatus Omnitrophota bacterium]
MNKEIKLGVFVLAVFGVFLFFTINMGGGLFSGHKRIYPVFFKNTGLLEKGAPVKQAGLNVGEVTNIALETVMEPTPTFYIKVDVSVNDNAHIAYDSEATIQTMGMMGEQYIEITFGHLEEAPEGARINGKGPQQLDRVMALASEAVVEIQKMVGSLNIIFADEKFQNNITDLIANLEQFSQEMNNLLGGENNRLKTILENTQTATANLNSLIASSELFVSDARSLINENRPHIKDTLESTSVIAKTLREELPDKLEIISGQLTSLSDELKKSAANANQLMVKFDSILDENRPDIREAMNQIKEFSVNAKTASDRVNHLIQRIDEGDGLAGRLINDPELSESVEHTISYASDVLGHVSDLGSRFDFEVDSRYFPDRPRFDSDDNNARVDLGVRYRMSDEMFLYLGGNSLGTANDFEGQLGYILGPVTFHGGIIESEFGLGLDWQIFDRWMIGLEGVGLTDEDHERLDAYTEFLLWKKIYLVGGVQDVTDDQYPNLGLKVRF